MPTYLIYCQMKTRKPHNLKTFKIQSNQQNHTNALHCINTLKDWIAIDDAIYFQYQELSQQIKINITR
jgi:hypothetical protein